MRNIYKLLTIGIGMSLLFQGCNKESLIVADAGDVDELRYITVSLDNATKTDYSMDGNTLKAFWSEGDIVSVVPDLGVYTGAGTYRVTDPGSSSGVFEMIKAVSTPASKYGYAIFYPGDRIKSLPQYTKFSYEGQIQKKSNPMGHIGKYHTMFVKTDDYSKISLAGADQSSCMKLSLKGMTFHNPVRIEVTVMGAERFYENNYVNENYSYYTSDAPKDLTSSAMIGIDLEGYDEEESLEAYIMMPNHTITLRSGDDLVVYVYQEDGYRFEAHIPITSAISLRGGKWHNLKIKNGWKQSDGFYGTYEWDGEVVTLQKGIDGLDLVLMGDGFIKDDFDNGTYESVMRQAYDEFFSVEPMKSIRKDFNVFYVKTPSAERTNAINTGANGAVNSGARTKFSVQFTANSTAIKGDNDLVREYAKKAFNNNASNRIKDATIVVMVNQACRAGTCWNSWYSSNGLDYGQANAIAYCALGRSDKERHDIMKHEIIGHGFGKLDDEYVGTNSLSNTQPWIDQQNYHRLGLYRNVDIFVNQNYYLQLNGKYDLTTTSNVYWHDMFGTSNNYESSGVEALGVFEGAGTYSRGFCRPTQDPRKSIMNSDGEYFNAISRRQLYYRYLRLARIVNSNIYGSSEELNRFLRFDAEHCLPSIIVNNSISGGNNISNIVDSNPASLQHAPAKLISGHWENGNFIADDYCASN